MWFQAAPAEFYRADYEDEELQEWGTIAVPSSWECEGHGVPIYTNMIYPFPKDPPRVPSDNNPTGCYRRTFKVRVLGVGCRHCVCVSGGRV